MYIDADQIINLIKNRRDWFMDAQIAGTAADPKDYSQAELNRAIADEYDSLLAEISSHQSKGFQTEVKG